MGTNQKRMRLYPSYKHMKRIVNNRFSCHTVCKWWTLWSSQIEWNGKNQQKKEEKRNITKPPNIHIAATTMKWPWYSTILWKNTKGSYFIRSFFAPMPFYNVSELYIILCCEHESKSIISFKTCHILSTIWFTGWQMIMTFSGTILGCFQKWTFEASTCLKMVVRPK